LWLCYIVLCINGLMCVRKLSEIKYNVLCFLHCHVLWFMYHEFLIGKAPRSITFLCFPNHLFLQSDDSFPIFFHSFVCFSSLLRFKVATKYTYGVLLAIWPIRANSRVYLYSSLLIWWKISSNGLFLIKSLNIITLLGFLASQRWWRARLTI
jgi:hypothetical protein